MSKKSLLTYLSLITVILASPQSLGSEFLAQVSGRYRLQKVTESPALNSNHASIKKCPDSLKVAFHDETARVDLKNSNSGKTIESFSFINKRDQIKKLDSMIWRETKTTLKRKVLTKRSRLCSGAIKRNCHGRKFKPKISLLSTEKDLIFNVYGSNHKLVAKCYYQRPNEIGL